MAKIRKIFLIVSFSIFLTACSKSKADTSFTTDEVPATSSDKLTIMHNDINNEGVKDFFEEVGKELNIDITVVESPINPDSRHAKISTLLASGDASVDIFTVNDEMISEFKNVGYIEKIDKEILANEELLGYPQDYIKQMIMKDNIPYSVPYRMDVLSLWVNQKWIEEAGLPNISSKKNFYEFLNQTWDDGKFSYGGAWEKTYVYNEIGEFICLFGGDYYNWNDPKTREAILFMKDLLTNESSSEDQMLDQYDQMNQKFIEGKYGMVFMFTGGMNTYLAAGVYGEDRIHMAELPALGQRATYIATWQYVLNGASKNKDAAKRFLKYVASKEGSIKYSVMSNSIPARLDIVNNEDLNITGIKEIKNYIKNTKLLARPIPQNSMTYIECFGGLFQKYITNEIDLDEYCEQVQELIDRNM